MAVVEEVTTAELEARPTVRSWSRLLPYATLAGYAVLIAVVIAHHEPWFDEAQAWLMARDSNLINLFQRLPYEGQPGLWHLLLMVPSKTLPYEVLNWISGGLGTLGVFVLLTRSPFPPLVKVLLPFTYFLFYQYGVVARNYALLPVTLFVVAALYPQRHERPWTFALVLFVLANTSTHGFLIAGSLLAVYVVEIFGRARKLSKRPGRPVLLAVICLALSMGVVALSLLPPADRTFALDVGDEVGLGTFLKFAGGMMNGSMAGNLLVLLPALLASGWFFRRARVLHLYVIPTLLLLAFFAFVHRAPWHEGVLFLVWIFTLWVGLQREVSANRLDERSRLAALTMLVVVGVVQIAWTVRTAALDLEGPYSGSRELATYLQTNRIADSSIFGLDWAAVAVNAYFGRNIYSNYFPPDGVSYWEWSKKIAIVDNFSDIEWLKPQFVVFPIKHPGSEKRVLDALPSYRQRAVFWGDLFWKGTSIQPDVYVLLERREASGS
ncbi:MAG: hypothetical protein M3198_04245 [Actinomycetota bacterium]|nr:hypothetical protein [Actinomycetota bacterium]